MRVVFVGMHNKPGMKPLDSKTRSGKLIDRVIKAMKDEGLNCEYLKTNLYNLDHWPKKNLSQTFEWAQRVEYTGNDIVLTLGQCVYDVFKYSNIEFIKLGHPSACWSHEKQSEYILRAVAAIKKVSMHTLPDEKPNSGQLHKHNVMGRSELLPLAFVAWLSGHDDETIRKMHVDWSKRQ